MTGHRVTGSRVVPGNRRRIVLILTCACGKKIRGSGWKMPNAETKARLAYNRHVKGR